MLVGGGSEAVPGGSAGPKWGPVEAIDYVPKHSEAAVPEWEAKCEPGAQHGSIQLPRNLALLHLFSASRLLILQNDAETPRYPRTVEENRKRLLSPSVLVALISPQYCVRK